jgi:hypothetical protein
MNNVMTKEFIHKDNKFNITVELDVEIERSPNGKRYSNVTIAYQGTPVWNITRKCLTVALVRTIQEIEREATNFSEGLTMVSQTEKNLLTMGFEYKK